MESDIAQAARIVAESRHLVAFTGAGISAESGIPTYRGAGGMWSKYDPARFASIDAFLEDPSYYWSFFKEERYPVLKAARPNPGHEALARLERSGRLRSVITQNIDGLQQMAGSKNVIELHGNTRTIACLKCGRTYSMDEIHAQLASRAIPECRGCDGLLKTTVVMFGENLPAAALREAFEQAAACDVMLCVGSSLVVHPAAAVPGAALDGGARLIIVNQDPTPLDHRAVVALKGKAGDILPRLAA
ncbi:MAG: NAD-dependent deacylase [Planctomycetes bacterium]|nr:NAD-dependent deacylase [Planctomycetota bacterium]